MKSTLQRYLGEHVPLVDGPRGARIAATTIPTMTATFAVQPRMIEVAKGVYNLVGIGISSRVMVDAPEGLVIFDTGDDMEDGERALSEFRKVSQRPIKAIIYSHNHYAHGTKPFLREAPDAMIIGHHQVNRFLSEIVTGFASGGEFPEAVPALTARYERQFAAHLPSEGPDTGLAVIIPPGRERGTALATHLVHDGDEMMVAGLRMRFYTEFFSDSEDTLTTYIPDLNLVYNNFFWPSLFNFYTLRGDVFRNPNVWRNGLKLIRDLEPELLLNTHALPVVGKEAVRDSLQNYMDTMSYLVDQTLRAVNKGLGPEELKEAVKLPPYLRDFPNNSEIYSEFFYFPLHLYYHIFGWFDGDAASIHRLPAAEEARRIVAGFGGVEVVLAQQRDAMAKGDLVWASRLAGWLLATDRENDVYRHEQAEALRQIAYRSPGTIPRHFCLSQALELERKIAIPGSRLPSAVSVLSMEPERTIDFQRIRLDVDRSLDVESRLVITISDRKVRHGLWVRRGVCEFQSDPGEARTHDATLELSYADWARLYVGETTLEALIDEGRAKANQRGAVLSFFSLFDTPQQSCGLA